MNTRAILPSSLLLALATAAACTPREAATVDVSSEVARACDVLVDVGDAAAPSVDFGTNVRGASSRHGARFGVSWVASNDRPFDARAVTLRGARAPKLLTSTCYDRDGRPIANPDVTLR